jgi:hypothetical protein
MPFDTWAIDGNVGNVVTHPASVARVQTFVAFEGREGVVGATDLRVLELATPGTSIRVMPGAAGILNRALGGTNQMYAVNLPASENVAVTATGAGAGRSDLVIARVENPFISGEPWTDMDGPFTYARIIEGVPASTTTVTALGLGYSAIPLARIDIPVSTGTITQAMIKNLRSTIGGGGGSEVITETNIAQQYVTKTAVGTGKWNTTAPKLLPSNTSFIDFPAAANWSVPIPSWATHMDYFCEIRNAHLNGGDVWGEMKLLVNGVSLPVNLFDLNQQSGVPLNGFRQVIGTGGTYVLPSAIRGTAPVFKMQAKNYVDARITGTLYFDDASYVFAFFNFKRLSALT